MEYAKLELDASRHGWRCSECGLQFDSIGRPILGDEPWVIISKSMNFLENKPKIKFCPQCGKPVKDVGSDAKKEI